MKQSLRWLVVMTKPKMETAAKMQLMRQGFEVYLPLWVESKRRQGTWRIVKSPMFPRYLFIRPNHIDQSLAPIRSTRGVSQLVHFGAEPAWVGEKLIHEVRLLERNRNRVTSDITPFKEGDQVQVLHGPFKGVSAEVLSSDKQRVILLLQVLGRIQRLEFKPDLCQIK